MMQRSLETRLTSLEARRPAGPPRLTDAQRLRLADRLARDYCAMERAAFIAHWGRSIGDDPIARVADAMEATIARLQAGRETG